jgi:DNA-binding Lrp family transcriptional regulator
MALDEVDLALLEALRVDGRASYETLGARSGVSRTAARARVQRLLEDGVVQIEAIVHPAVEGIHTFAHVSIATDGGSAPQVAAKLAALDQAPLVSLVAGRWSMIAELRTADLGEMDRALAAVRDIPGVVSIDTTLYVDIVKDSHLPLGGTHSFESFELDDIDHRLLDLLRADPRMPYADLAAKVELSRGATRARMLRLLRDSVVAVTGMINATTLGITQMCGFQVHLANHGRPATEEIAALPEVDFLSRTVGRCDLIGTIIAESRQDVHRTLDTIRTFQGVRTVEAWYHLDLIKEWYEPRMS